MGKKKITSGKHQASKIPCKCCKREQKKSSKWKKKAIKRGAMCRELRKTVKKQLEKINQIKSKEEEPVPEITKPLQKNIHVVIVLLLFSNARISFRGIERVLGVLQKYLNLTMIPCTQTVINWVNKFAIARYRQGVLAVKKTVSTLANRFVFMIDESIGISDRKVFTVLAIPADCYRNHQGYPKLLDYRVVASAVSSSWTGENIALFLEHVVTMVGKPLAWIKDGGSNLGKALNLLEKQSLGSPAISDISHVCANLLKDAYSHHPDLEPFLSACGSISKALKQTILACLAPPASRTKSRFMNLHKLVAWAKRLFPLSPIGRARKGSKLEQLRQTMSELRPFQRFVHRFIKDSSLLLESQKILKQQGFNHKTAALCREAIKPATASIRAGMNAWLDQMEQIHGTLGLKDHGLMCTTDGLESLFGLAKSHGLGEIKDPYRMALRLTAMCSHPTLQDADAVLKMTHSELAKSMKSLPSVQGDRRAIFGGRMDLEAISPSKEIWFMPSFGCIPREAIGKAVSHINTRSYVKTPCEITAYDPFVEATARDVSA